MPVATHLCTAIKVANLPFLIKTLRSRMHSEPLLKYDFLTSWVWILPELVFASLQISQSAECSYWDGAAAT